MKNRNPLLLSILLLMIVASAAKLLGATARDVDAYISDVKGKVEVKTADSEVWVSAGIGTVIKEGMWIRTKAASEATVDSERGHSLKISSLTSMQFTELQLKRETGQKTSLNIEQGRVMAKVAKLSVNSDFSVRTPTATAAVRGTRFVVETDEKQSKFTVLEGSLSIIAENVEMILDQNFQSVVESGMPPAETAPIPEDLRQELNKEMGAPAKDEKSGKTQDGAKQGGSNSESAVDESFQGELIEEYGTPGAGCCDR